MKDRLEEILGKGRLKKNQDLSPLLTIKIGAKAKFFFEAKTREDLINAKKASLLTTIPLLIIGGGSNLIISKKIIEGLVVKNSYRQFKVLENKAKTVLVSVSSGYPVSSLVNQTVEKGWEGFQYHLGLPGTVGGAIYNNSKWTKPTTYFGDNLQWAYLVDGRGQEKKVTKRYFRFDYDFSILQQTQAILLEAVFGLKKTDIKKLKRQAKMALDYRRKTQPQGVLTSGCFFKNIAGQPAGYLIDKAGLKGYRVGGFQVSDKHANFIINTGQGKADELKKLVKIIKDKVKEKFSLELQEEVVVV